MENIVIIRYSEISLKGNNRIVFEKRLIDNIKDCLKKNKVKYEKIERLRGRIIIFAEQELNCLKYVFGISSFSHALVIEPEIKEIEKTVSKIIENKKFRSFRVSAQRLNKNFSLTSPEIERTIGSFMCEKFNKKVSLKNFDLEIGIEILDKAYVFTERVKGLNGLPVGVEGKVVSLIEDENSLLASLLMMKRGCFVIPVSLKKTDIDLIKKFAYGFEPELIIIKSIEELDEVSKENNARAVVVGQTFETFKELNIKAMVLRPLVGLDKKEIKQASVFYSAH
ncbi:MAG: hypothetical protein KKF74_02360 [Nanoarchaeota archaeon]|nr:hypothetical protein [Nanoarchaeota archaeon]